MQTTKRSRDILTKYPSEFYDLCNDITASEQQILFCYHNMTHTTVLIVSVFVYVISKVEWGRRYASSYLSTSRLPLQQINYLKIYQQIAYLYHSTVPTH
jgi:hypothetical protein